MSTTGWPLVVLSDATQLTIRSGNPAAEACDALVVPVAADKRLSGPAAAEHGRLAGGAAVQGLSGMTIGSVVLPERADAPFVQGLAEGLALASYRFDRYRTPRNPRPPCAGEPRFIVPEHAGEEATAAPPVLVGKGLTFDG